MNYTFPTIRHISDVLPHIADDNRFVCVKKDGGYTVINYVRYDSGTFPALTWENDLAAKIRRECRGLIFDTKTGVLLSRPFHKFFNAGETEELALDNIDLSKSHDILEKLDGSMVRPLFFDGSLRWATKMGLTDVSNQVDVFTLDKPNYLEFCKQAENTGCTPIFEWVSAQNRIVLEYEEGLHLLAIRTNTYGNYATYKDLIGYADEFKIPYVQPNHDILRYLTWRQTPENVIRQVKSLENSEGIVISFSDGHKIKVKSDWYVALHRVKAAISSDKNLLKVILEDKVDDLYPILNDKDAAQLKDFVDSFWLEIDKSVERLSNNLIKYKSEMSRKEFAFWSGDNLKGVEKLDRSIYFKCWDGDVEIRQAILNVVTGNLGKWKRFYLIKHLYGDLEWRGGMFDD